MSSTINKAELISKLQTLEGLTIDERSSLIGLLREHKKYGLVWEDKPEDVEERLREELPILREVKDKAILSDDTDAPNHILIEGDNLEALTALSYTHEGKIDVIYIDPPYNTGNKDFVYNDSFVDSEDCYRHSKWLSFMNKRLKIAKRLLSDKGVIFISIDDNEQANTKLLCDETFGRSNFIAQVIWERAYSPVNLKKHFSESHDYIIVYANRIENAVNNGLPRSNEANERYSNPDKDPRGVWKSTDCTVGPAVEDKLYQITLPSGRIVNPPSGRCWLFTKDRFEEMVSDNRIWFGANGDSVPAVKKFLSEVKQGITPMTIWKYSEVGHSQDAAKEVKDIFGGEARFTYPKSMRLIKRCIGLYSQNDSIILDFFAGSGTTLHATMQLNAEDGGHRQCILVTNNENNICEEVTYERNKRVINGYTTPKGVKVEGLKANTLRYYRTDYISRDRTQKNMRDLVAAATDLLCIKEDLYEEQKKFGRFKLKPQLARYFDNGKKHMLIVYREELIDEIAEEVKNLDFGKMRLKIYVFSPGRYAFNDNFREVEDKVELVALPAAIYDAYQKVLPKRREKLFETEEKKETSPASQDLFANEEEGGEA